MLQLHNHTRFAAAISLLPNEAGIDTLYIVVKASFTMGKALTLADEQTPPTVADVYWGEPNQSSIRYASDMHLGKPATDIIMLGHACAPDQKEVRQLDVDLSVGSLRKTVRVFGDRQWQDGRITPPQPFTTLPLVYERAYGGTHHVEGKIDSAETRNPVGRGYTGNRKSKAMNGMPLPNLEDPQHLIHDLADQPPPACFGYVAPNWQPRAAYAGTYDETWQQTRSPYLPKDFDKRFFNMAHPDLVYPGYLQGDEPITITNMHPRGEIQFNLPRMKLVAHVAVANREYSTDFSLETLILEPNQHKMSIVWRAAMPCDKQSLKIQDVKVSMVR